MRLAKNYAPYFAAIICVTLVVFVKLDQVHRSSDADPSSRSLAGSNAAPKLPKPLIHKAPEDPRLAAVSAFYHAWATHDPAAAYAMLDSGWKDTMSFDEFRGLKNGRQAIIPYYSIMPRAISVVGDRGVKVSYIVPSADENSHIATWALRNVGGHWLLEGFHEYEGAPAAYRPQLIIGEDADSDLRDFVGLPLSSDLRARESIATHPVESSAPRYVEPSAPPQYVAPPLTFHGYACTVDCSGHEAGYNWAEEHDITDHDDCPNDPNNSHSFTEGCWAYADEQSGDNNDDTPP
jgi:hypothetical protein